MDVSQFERLLFEEEIATLDFKEAQYPFAKALDDDKSEILKDILGFANAWRRADAFILIGVRDVRGGKSEVIGIPETDHLADHSLQQFVNSRTNRPVQFAYEAFSYDGKHVGVIRVDQQTRPVYLKKDYGKLEANKVYVRRGSSTDPTTPATPDEIAQMGMSSAPEQAQLRVAFADLQRDEAIGQELAFETEFLDLPRHIPGYGTATSGLTFDITKQPNSDYLRERAAYELWSRLVRPVRLIVENGAVPTTGVRIEMSVSSPGAIVVDADELPEPPSKLFDPIVRANQSLRHLEPLRKWEGAVTVKRANDGGVIEVEGGRMQPGRKILSDHWYVGRRDSGDVEFVGRILADNLPKPLEFRLAVAMQVTQRTVSIDEIRALPLIESDDGNDW